MPRGRQKNLKAFKPLTSKGGQPRSSICGVSTLLSTCVPHKAFFFGRGGGIPSEFPQRFFLGGVTANFSISAQVPTFTFFKRSISSDTLIADVLVFELAVMIHFEGVFETSGARSSVRMSALRGDSWTVLSLRPPPPTVLLQAGRGQLSGLYLL